MSGLWVVLWVIQFIDWIGGLLLCVCGGGVHELCGGGSVEDGLGVPWGPLGICGVLVF